MSRRMETLEVKLDHLTRMVQDLLILHSLQAGIGSHEVAAIVKIDKKRVSKISKHLKSAK